MRLLQTFVGVGLTAWAVTVFAQTPADRPTFDAASVKVNHSGTSMWRLGYPAGGRFTATNATALALIASAYGPLSGYQITGYPDWVKADRFDIEAKAQREPPRDADGVPNQVILMLRTLLAQRFALIVHKETRQAPVYALVLARKDRTLGPQLREVTVDCAALRQPGGAAQRPDRPPCAIGGGASGSLIGGAVTMSQLATALSNRVNRPVVDQSGLNGTFDFDLVWTSDQASSGLTDPAVLTSSDVPTIFTALQEQLGLRLEPSRGPVDTVVIDHIEHPTEN